MKPKRQSPTLLEAAHGSPTLGEITPSVGSEMPLGAGGVFQRFARAAAILCLRASRSAALMVFGMPLPILPSACAALFIGLGDFGCAVNLDPSPVFFIRSVEGFREAVVNAAVGLDGCLECVPSGHLEEALGGSVALPKHDVVCVGGGFAFCFHGGFGLLVFGGECFGQVGRGVEVGLHLGAGLRGVKLPADDGLGFLDDGRCHNGGGRPGAEIVRVASDFDLHVVGRAVSGEGCFGFFDCGSCDGQEFVHGGTVERFTESVTNYFQKSFGLDSSGGGGAELPLKNLTAALEKHNDD